MAKSKVYFVLGFLFLSFMINFTPFLLMENEETQPFSQEDPVLQICDQSINITTPENTTYCTPMSGYYPGTEGFEDVADGDLPDNWNYSGLGSGYYAEVVASKMDANGVEHNKVLYCHDGALVRRLYAWGLFNEPQTFGTYEFWILIINTGQVARFGLTNTLGAWTVYMLEEFGLFKFYHGSTLTSTGISCTENKWYRISVDFDDNGGYAGLSAHQYKFRIYDSDGTSLLYTSPVANFQNNGDSNAFNLNTGSNAFERLYFDAIGYSWDPNYDIGDNIDEELLLSFTSETELDWMAYSLNGQSNVTIPGNTTIPMPGEGSHAIQVYANNSMGTMYTSELRHFTINRIKINFPSPYDAFGELAPSFNIWTIVSNIDMLWYTLNGGVTNTTFLTNGTINQSLWDAKGYGTITLRFHINDTIGDEWFTSVIIKKITMNLTTPENKTYFSPMNGYYPGTEGFEDVADGTLPDNWYYTGFGGHYAEVVTSKMDVNGVEHNKVMYCHDSGGGSRLTAWGLFNEPQTFGTYEFWILIINTGEVARFGFLTTLDVWTVYMLEEFGVFKFYDGASIISTGIGCTANKWYRISVDFDDNGGYAGLSAHQYKFRIYDSDGTTLIYSSPDANFQNNGDSNAFHLNTGDDAAERLYFDAIGYSWDSNYDIGDNIYEGLVLNFTIGTELDWIGYSLDGQNNLTIPGNTTIPMPDEGSHAIQVYANNSIGTKFATAIIYFTVFVDYYLDIINHTENGVSVPPGLIEVNANADFNVTLTCGTRAGSSYYTWTNASFSYRINEGSWTGPSFIGSHYGIKNSTFVIEEGNYSINDNLYYYVYFIQLDNSSNILEEFYWTQDGIKYDENEARLAAFHKRVNTVLYNLTLDYSVFYRAQLERVMPNEVGFNESVYPWKNIAYENISLSFYNTTSAKTNFSVSCINESKLAHYVDEITRNISKAVDPQFDVNQGIMSPFTLSLSNNYIADFSNITIPQISFDSINDSRNLTFTGNLLNVTYKGVENFPYSYRTVLRFSTVDENIIIRFDMFTGIMVYFYYCNATANASQAITFALIDNNQNYPINLLVEMRYETEEDGFIIIPRYLWNIIHDPPGDQSYCSLAAGTTITKGFSIEIGVSSGIYFEFQALGCGVGGGMSFEMKHKTSTEFDFEFEITYGTFLTSSTNSENSSLIGPGRGDLYYGSGLVLQYFIKVNNYYIVIGDQDPVDSQLDDKKIWQNGSRVEYGLSADTEFTVLGAQLDYYGMSDLAAYNMFADNNITEEEEPYVELAAGPLFWTPNTISEYSYAHSSTFGMTLTNTIEFSLDAFFCWDIEVEEFWTGATVFQSEGKIGVTVEFSMETVSTSSTEFNREIVCHLEDDDGAPIGEHDQFMSYIYHDLQYSTYGVIYVENFTYTSRPFEIGTKDRRSPTTSEIYDLAEYVQGVITLNCGAIDDETGVNHVKFYYDNDPIFDEDSTQIGYQDNSTIGDPNLYQFSWNTSLLHGTYYLFAVTFDNADPQWNSKISDTYSINIDNILPTTCQARAYEPYRDAINLYVNAFDADSGIEYVEYWDGDPDNPGSTLLGISYEPSSSFNFVWATAPNGADDGTHYIYARAYDKAGNYLDSSAIDIKVDNLSVPISTTEILLWSILILGIVGISAYILNNTIFKRRTRPEAPPPKKIPPPKSKFTKSSGKITESSDQ